MTELHEKLRELVAHQGPGVVEQADAFRGAMDDFLTEEEASAGEMNLLVDAVRLGGVQRLLGMLDNGAAPGMAVREAGAELARDRSSDVGRSQWAVAALGFALGRIDAGVVRSFAAGPQTAPPQGPTQGPGEPPGHTAARPVPAQPTAPPTVHSPQPPYTPHSPSPQAPAAQQQPWSNEPPRPGGFPPPGGYPPPAPRKSHTGLIIGLVVAAVVLIGGVIGLVAALGGDDGEPSADDPGSSESDESETPTGEMVEGDGYSYVLPDGWQDITDQVLADNPGQPTLDTASAWGPSIEQGRANMIIEVSPWVFTDLDEAQEQLSTNLASLGGTVADLDDRTIDGKDAGGVVLTRFNDSGIEVEQNAYIVQNGDNAVVITTSHKADDDGLEDTYEEIYDSWSWKE